MTVQLPSKDQLAELFARPNDLHDMTPACGFDLYPCTRVYDADNADEKIEALQLELKNVQEQYTNYHDWAQDEIERLEYERDVWRSKCEMLRKARAEIDRLRTTLTGIASCSTCEACRGAANRALGEQP